VGRAAQGGRGRREEKRKKKKEEDTEGLCPLQKFLGAPMITTPFGLFIRVLQSTTT